MSEPKISACGPHRGTASYLALKVFQEGYGPSLPPAGLALLLTALRTRDRRLAVGTTTVPPPIPVVYEWPVEAADPVAFALWQGRDMATVDEVEHAWADACSACDERLGERAACRWFLNWWDEQGTADFPLACDVLASAVEPMLAALETSERRAS